MKSRLVAAAAALLFSAFAVAPATAQDPNNMGTGNGPAGSRNGISAPSERVTPSRTQRPSDNQPRRERQPAPPTPEQILAAAQEQATLGSTNCQVSEAKLLGQTAEKTSVYEVACAAGPGFILESKTPPTVTSCISLAYSARVTRERDPAADVGLQCTIAANTDTDKFLREYAQQAGVPCAVDQTKVLGQSNGGVVVYEIGCSDGPGFWIKQEAGSWSKTPCIQVLAENGTCEFTTTSENAAYVKTLLSGSEAASCNVTEARLMGQNANGTFFEAKCDGADGVIARLNAENAVQQIYPCTTAQRIGGGCKLTTAPAAAAAPAGGRP